MRARPNQRVTPADLQPLDGRLNDSSNGREELATSVLCAQISLFNRLSHLVPSSLAGK